MSGMSPIVLPRVRDRARGPRYLHALPAASDQTCRDSTGEFCAADPLFKLGLWIGRWGGVFLCAGPDPVADSLEFP